MKKFEVGKIYTLSFTYGDGVFAYECVKRTEKMVWFKGSFDSFCCKIKNFRDHESCYPKSGIMTAEDNQLPVHEYTGC